MAQHFSNKTKESIKDDINGGESSGLDYKSPPSRIFADDYGGKTNEPTELM